MSLMSAEGIGVQYGNRRVLQHMNFSIEAGEVVTIVGPNGAGKSVFLRVLIGAEQPSEGRVKRILCNAGEAVSAGAKLVELEALPDA